jgi:hypothetical protein
MLRVNKKLLYGRRDVWARQTLATSLCMGVQKQLNTSASLAAAHIVTTTRDTTINADKQRLVAKMANF